MFQNRLNTQGRFGYFHTKTISGPQLTARHDATMLLRANEPRQKIRVIPLTRLGTQIGHRSIVIPFVCSRRNRERYGPDGVLSEFRGFLMADGWTGFQQIGLRSDLRITRVACSAPARRKVFGSRTTYPAQASILLAMIRQLYGFEHRGKELSPKNRRSLRQTESIAVLNRKKAYLKSDATSKRSANLLTLVSTSHRNDLDVWINLTDVLNHLLAGSTDYESMRADEFFAVDPFRHDPVFQPPVSEFARLFLHGHKFAEKFLTSG